MRIDQSATYSNHIHSVEIHLTRGELETLQRTGKVYEASSGNL